MEITYKLDKNDLTKILVNHFKDTKGVDVEVKFDVGSDCVGYGVSERMEPVFRGVVVTETMGI